MEVCAYKWLSIGRCLAKTAALLTLVSCASGGRVEYERRSVATYAPTSSINVYWGDDARSVGRKYSIIATTYAEWAGADSGSFGRGGDGTTTRDIRGEPATKLPDAYRRKAMELGAQALLIPLVKEVVKSTVTPRHTLYFTTGPVTVPAGVKVTTTYYALVEAVRWED